MYILQKQISIIVTLLYTQISVAFYLTSNFSIKKVSIVLQGQQLYSSFNLKVASVCLAGAAYNTSHYPLATKSCIVLAFSGYCIAWGWGCIIAFYNDACGLFVPSPLLG